GLARSAGDPRRAGRAGTRPGGALSRPGALADGPGRPRPRPGRGAGRDRGAAPRPVQARHAQPAADRESAGPRRRPHREAGPAPARPRRRRPRPGPRGAAGRLRLRDPDGDRFRGVRPVQAGAGRRPRRPCADRRGHLHHGRPLRAARPGGPVRSSADHSHSGGAVMSESDVRLDGATAEVVRSYLLAAAEEMRATLIRTSFNPVIYEVHDFGLSMYDADLRLIAEATGLTFFLGANDFSLAKGVEYVGRENLHRGDVVLLNYPYCNAAHSYDATLFAPVFQPDPADPEADGTLVGFLCVRAHWMDLGAKDPGYVLDSTDMHQEGLIFPGTKVFSRGEPVREIHELIRFNSRMPDLVIGDLHAQVAALRTGERRLLEILEKFGRPTVDAAVQRMIEDGEARTRAALAALPQGTWTAEDWLDDDGISEDPVKMRVTVTVADGRFTVDFDGSAPATPGPINMPFGATIAICKVVLKALTSPDEPSNHGTTVP